MLYLINYSNVKGSGSNLTQSQIQMRDFHLQVTLRLQGLTVDYK